MIIHNSVSVDGNIDGFALDIGLHYAVAARFTPMFIWPAATRASAPWRRRLPSLQATICSHLRLMIRMTGDRYWWLWTVTARSVPGRRCAARRIGVTAWWRCAREARRRLPAATRSLQHIDCIVAGEEAVDLAVALRELEGRYRATRVLVDSGGVLNGVLLRAGLVAEVSLLVHPSLVDGAGFRSMFRPPDGGDAVALWPRATERFAGDIVWLRYDVVVPTAGAG